MSLHALAARRLGRDLTAGELAIDLAAADAALETGKAELHAAIEEEKARAARAMTRGLARTRLEVTPRMVRALRALYRAGQAEAQGEVARLTGAAAPARALAAVPPEIDAHVAELRRHLAGISGRLEAEYADDLASVGLGGLAAGALERALVKRVPGALAAAADLVSGAYGTGLADGFAPSLDLFASWTYSAIMDAGTCTVCAYYDGHEYDSWDAIQSVLPDGGPNPGCHGGGRCRCRPVPGATSSTYPDSDVTPPPVLDPRRSALAAAVKSGVRETATLTGGNRAASVERVVFNNGETGVLKTLTAEEADREELAALVADAVGARVPAVVRLADDRVAVEYVEGQTGLRARLEDDAATIESDDGHLLGILDLLISNPDRHGLNWIVSDGRVVGIDHGNAFSFRRYEDGDPKSPTYGQEVLLGPDSPFSAPLFRRSKYREIRGYKKNRLTTADAERLRGRLEALQPEFDRLRRRAWYDEMIGQLDEIAAKAAGKRDLIP